MIGEAKNDGRGADRHRRRRPEKKHWEKKKALARLLVHFFSFCTFWVTRTNNQVVLCGGSVRGSIAALENTTMILFFFLLTFSFLPLTSSSILLSSTSLFSLSSHSRPPPYADRQTVRLAVLHHPRHAAAQPAPLLRRELHAGAH